MTTKCTYMTKNYVFFYSRLLKDINYSFEKMHNFFYVILTYVAKNIFCEFKSRRQLTALSTQTLKKPIEKYFNRM